MPFEVPQSWCWTTLGEIFTLQAGKNIAAKEISDRQDETYPFPCYGGNGIRGYVSSHNRNGHFPLIGRQGALCGNINVADGLFYATEHAVVVETYCNIDVVWAVNALTYLNLNQYATSTAQPGLSVSTINEVMIPLPPIEEQNRIVYNLSKWFALIDTVESGKSDLQTSIKQAKSKILDLAIHGKLVPQDPNDEPASELLKRINPNAEITCDNGQYEKLPDGWGLIMISQVVELLSGRDLTSNDCNEDEEGVPYLIGASNIVNNHLNITRWTKNPQVISSIGDILISCKGTIGEIVLNDIGNIHVARQFMVIRPNKNSIVTEYLQYYLLAMVHNIKENARGVIPGISREDILTKYFPLPPLAEQQRIVDAIDNTFAKLDAIMESL